MEDAWHFYGGAQWQLVNGNYEEANRLIDINIELEGENLNNLTLKSEILFGLNDFENCIIYCNKVLDINYDKFVLLDKLESLKNLERYGESLKCCDEIIENDAKFFRAYSIKSFILTKLNRFDDAFNCCNELIKNFPEIIWGYVIKASIYEELCEYDKVIMCYDSGLESIPNNFSLLHEKSLFLFRIDRFDEAKDILSKINPKEYWQWLLLAEDYKKIKLFENALNCCNKVIELKPEFEEGFLLKSQIYFELNDFNHALEECFHAIKLNPEYYESRKFYEKIKSKLDK